MVEHVVPWHPRISSRRQSIDSIVSGESAYIFGRSSMSLALRRIKLSSESDLGAVIACSLSRKCSDGWQSWTSGGHALSLRRAWPSRLWRLLSSDQSPHALPQSRQGVSHVQHWRVKALASGTQGGKLCQPSINSSGTSKNRLLCLHGQPHSRIHRAGSPKNRRRCRIPRVRMRSNRLPPAKI